LKEVSSLRSPRSVDAVDVKRFFFFSLCDLFFFFSSSRGTRLETAAFLSERQKVLPFFFSHPLTER